LKNVQFPLISVIPAPLRLRAEVTQDLVISLILISLIALAACADDKVVVATSRQLTMIVGYLAVLPQQTRELVMG